MDFCLSWPLCLVPQWPTCVFLFELSVYYIGLNLRPFCIGHTINTHYHGYIIELMKEDSAEEIRLSQFF